MNLLWTHILRGAQLVLAALVFALAIDSCVAFYVPGFYPSQSAFLAFCGAWTILVTLYFILAPRVFTPAAHPLARLAVDAVTCLFWFAGFIALAVAVSAVAPVVGGIAGAEPLVNQSSFKTSGMRWYQVSAAAAAFGGAEWALFVVTTTFTAIEVHRGRSHLFKQKADNPGQAPVSEAPVSEPTISHVTAEE